MTQSELALQLGLKQPTVAKHHKAGMPTGDAESARAWMDANLRHRRRKGVRIDTLAPGAAPAAPGSAGASMASKLTAARLLREESDADSAKIKALALRGEMMHTDLALRMWRNIAARCREPLLCLGPRMAPLLAPESDQATVELMLTREAHRILTELAAGIANAEATVAAEGTHADA